MKFHFYVAADDNLTPEGKTRHLYDGPDAADAMAAWSGAVAEGGAEYVVMEAVRIKDPCPECGFYACTCNGEQIPRATSPAATQ